MIINCSVTYLLTYLLTYLPLSVVQLKSVIDRDSLCPRQDTCHLEFDIVIGPADLFNIISVNLTIVDVNDHRPQVLH